MRKLAALAFHATTPPHEAATAKALLEARMAALGVNKWPPRTARPPAGHAAPSAPRVVVARHWQDALHAIEDDLRAIGFVVSISKGGTAPAAQRGVRHASILTYSGSMGRRSFRVATSPNVLEMGAVERVLLMYLKGVGSTVGSTSGIVYGWSPAAPKSNDAHTTRTVTMYDLHTGAPLNLSSPTPAFVGLTDTFYVSAKDAAHAVGRHIATQPPAAIAKAVRDRQRVFVLVGRGFHAVGSEPKHNGFGAKTVRDLSWDESARATTWLDETFAYMRARLGAALGRVSPVAKVDRQIKSGAAKGVVQFMMHSAAGSYYVSIRKRFVGDTPASVVVSHGHFGRSLGSLSVLYPTSGVEAVNLVTSAVSEDLGVKRNGASMDVANTIASQLGGTHRLVSMIGAHGFTGSENALSFRVKAANPRKIKAIRIVLDPSDTYSVAFFTGTRYSMHAIETVTGVYADSLRETIERVTGLYLSLGGMKGNGVRWEAAKGHAKRAAASAKKHSEAAYAYAAPRVREGAVRAGAAVKRGAKRAAPHVARGARAAAGHVEAWGAKLNARKSAKRTERPLVKLLSRRKTSQTVRGATFHAYDIVVGIRDPKAPLGYRFVELQGDAHGNVTLPTGMRSATVRAEIIRLARRAHR